MLPHELLWMLLQLSVATAIQSPTCPVLPPGMVGTQRHGFVDEFLPNGAGFVPYLNHWPVLGHDFVVVFHHVPFVNGFAPYHGLQPFRNPSNAWPFE